MRTKGSKQSIDSRAAVGPLVSLGFQLLTDFHLLSWAWVKDAGFTERQFSTWMAALLICAEMLAFALAHRQVFSFTDFVPSASSRQLPGAAAPVGHPVGQRHSPGGTQQEGGGKLLLCTAPLSVARTRPVSRSGRA